VERRDQAADKAVNEPGPRKRTRERWGAESPDSSRAPAATYAAFSCHIVLDAAAGDCCSFRKLYSGVFVMQAGKNRNGGDPEYDAELMAEKQVLGFKPAARLEQVDG